MNLDGESRKEKRLSDILLPSPEDDEIHQVCQTPGDPSGYTRQHSGRSGLLLCSPWLNSDLFPLLEYVAH